MPSSWQYATGQGYRRVGPAVHNSNMPTGGMVASVCDADFGAVLEEVGRGSVVLPRRFGLSAVPDGDAINVLVDGDPVETFVVELDEAGELATLVFDEAPPAASAVVVTYPVSNR